MSHVLFTTVNNAANGWQLQVSTAPDPNLVCAICLDVFNQPVRAECGHVYCRGCLVKWTSNRSEGARCPECREPISMAGTRPDRLVDKLCDNLPTTCQMRHRGCSWVGRRGDKVVHIACECPLVTVFCPDCECEVLRGDLAAHLECCEERFACSPMSSKDEKVDDIITDTSACGVCDDDTPAEPEAGDAASSASPESVEQSVPPSTLSAVGDESGEQGGAVGAVRRKRACSPSAADEMGLGAYGVVPQGVWDL